MLLIGSAQNFLGYGWLWLIVTRQAPALPLWMVSSSFAFFSLFIMGWESFAPFNGCSCCEQ
jgi:superoxide dismutase